MLSVIVPVYNERENARELVERTLAAFARLPVPAELVVVDDRSPDGTADEVRRAAERLGERERVRVIVRDGRRGLARAVAAGLAAARGSVLAVMDGDLSHPPELLPDLLAAVRPGQAGQGRAAVASRYVRGGEITRWTPFRRIASRAACLLARPLTPLRDCTSGYFAFPREWLGGDEGLGSRPHGFKIGLELFTRPGWGEAVEVPYRFTDRERGRSKLTPWVVAAYLLQLGSLYGRRAFFRFLPGFSG